jgi:hypothetical protein
VAQLEAALDAQKRVATSAFEDLKRAENELYIIEKRMHQSVQGVRDAESKLISQATLDVERYLGIRTYILVSEGKYRSECPNISL